QPVYALLGGKVRNNLATYVHVNGANASEVHGKIVKLKDLGFDNFRVQFAIPNLASYGSGLSFQTKAGEQTRQDYRLALNQALWNEDLYFEYTLQELRALRNLDGEIGIIHDVHERIAPTRAVAFAKSVEDLGLLFLEDPVAPEHIEFLADINARTTTPIAFGELLNAPSDYNRLISERLIAYLRCHITQIGGFTPALKLASTAESFGIKTAFHGPGDLSPVGHAAHMHLGALTPNFGIQEIYLQSERSDAVFPGSPEIRAGKMQINDRPGFGVEIDEDAAAQFPYPDHAFNGAWPEIRSNDGSIIKP
ncbi:MAG: enolase C-terminal domain-like protein, partial [Actinomycetota bacterium]